MIFIIRLVVAFVFLAIASKQDINTREVEDWIWKLMLAYALVILLFDINFLEGYKRDTIITELFLMSMLILLSYVIYKGFNKMKEGSFGGADAKAFACIAILLPYPLVFGIIPLSFLVVVWAELLSFAFYLPIALRLPREQWHNITFPLIPFVLVGLGASLLLYVVEKLMVV